ncbi:hypothetical protein [Nonomuraea jabiensis]|uniref:Uncharacterized protein n=1 Tax=Nonomuraea jabiensis TaxID=882448 RepID=A0A7W9GGM4_9ACTN|nr:hypothetical protein [Nonomuraea jabiensis]MBB5783412.1 hypothetical protein [Nonomuraea jabiensis]
MRSRLPDADPIIGRPVPRLAGAFVTVATVFSALVIINLCWAGAEWTSHPHPRGVVSDPHFPDGASALLWSAYIAGPASMVLYRIYRTPVGLRVMPLCIGLFAISQAAWFAEPVVGGGSLALALSGALFGFGIPALIGLAFIAYFVRLPYGIDAKRRSSSSLVVHLAAAVAGIALGFTLYAVVVG